MAMDEDELMMWDLFCTTGEPRYYSMYALARDNRRKREQTRDGE